LLDLAQTVEAWVATLDFDHEETSEHQDSLKLMLYGDYRCLTPELIMREQNTQIVSIAKELKVSTAAARILLNHYKWQRGPLITKFQQAKKTETEFNQFCLDVGISAAGVKPPTIEDFLKTYECPGKPIVDNMLFTVVVGCFEEYSFDQVTGLGCHHFYWYFVPFLCR
jgi:hypothetical protein